MASVKTWFCVNENDLKISRNELMMILDNVVHDGISINAGGRFTINYSFVGTVKYDIALRFRFIFIFRTFYGIL